MIPRCASPTIEIDAAYIYLTDVPLASGRDTIPVELPPDISGDVILDFKDGVLVGVEVLGAQSLLPRDLLDRAT